MFFIITGKTKGLLIVVIISLTNDLFSLPFGFSLSLHHFVVLLYFPITFAYFFKSSTKIKYVISPLFVEIFYLIFLAILFGFIFPWRSSGDSLRSWHQIAEGHAAIQIIRLFADIGIALFIYYLRKKFQ